MAAWPRGEFESAGLSAPRGAAAWSRGTQVPMMMMTMVVVMMMMTMMTMMMVVVMMMVSR